MDDRTEIELVYITIAKNRRRVLIAFKDESLLRPSEISKKIGMDIKLVSYNLRKLNDNGYVFVLNPECTKPRYYQLTEKGRKILNLLK